MPMISIPAYWNNVLFGKLKICAKSEIYSEIFMISVMFNAIVPIILAI